MFEEPTYGLRYLFSASVILVSKKSLEFARPVYVSNEGSYFITSFFLARFVGSCSVGCYIEFAGLRATYLFKDTFCCVGSAEDDKQYRWRRPFHTGTPHLRSFESILS